MKRILTRILNFGIHQAPSPEFVRNIRALNLFIFISTLAYLSSSINMIFLGDKFAFAPIVASFVVNFIPYFLNKRKLLLVAVYIFILNVNLLLFYTINIYPLESGMYNFCFPIIICSALIYFNPKKITHTVILFSISILLLLISFYTSLYFNQIVLTKTESLNSLMYCSATSVILTAVLTAMFQRLVNRQNKKLKILLRKQSDRENRINQSLREKEILLAEVHHRVKNNLSIVSSLLNLQIGLTDNEVVKETLNDSKNRVISMAKVHEKLLSTKNFESLNLSHYIIDLCNEINSTVSKSKEIKFEYFFNDNIVIDLKRAIPLGLIVNESITNSIKHGYKNSNKDCTIKIFLNINNNNLELIIHDNGEGFPINVEEKLDSLGLIVINALAEQLDAKLNFSNENGAKTRLVLKY